MRATQKGLSIEGVQGHNRQVILKALHDLGTCSRKDISVVSGLDQATVTRAIDPLLDDGIVEEVGLVKGGRGRRSINLDFSASGRHILCLRLQRRDVEKRMKRTGIDTRLVIGHATIFYCEQKI